MIAKSIFNEKGKKILKDADYCFPAAPPVSVLLSPSRIHAI